MKANELMIGNYIHDSWGNVHEVTLFTLKEIIEMPENHGYKPIPLTEEWLLKFGFETIGGSIMWSLGNFHIGWYGNKFATWYIRYEKMFYDNGNKINNEIYSDVEFVLQLQNLYFALTQKN
jgi:hypothetical protein